MDKLQMLITHHINPRNGEEVSLRDCGLFSKDIPEIVAALNKKANIISVDLSFNNLDDECVESLCQLEYVRELNLSRNNINEKSFDLIKKFKRLDLSNNFISITTAEKIPYQEINCSWLSLKNNGLSQDLLEQIDKCLKPKTTSVLSKSSPLMNNKKNSEVMHSNNECSCILI